MATTSEPGDETPGALRQERTRWYDRGFWGYARFLLRAFWMTAITAMVAISVVNIQSDVDISKRESATLSREADLQKEGRAFALSVICGVTNAIADAGRAVITGGGGPGLNPEFTRNLEALGYPSERERRAAAKQAGQAYAQNITGRVASAADLTEEEAEAVVTGSGTLNCDELLKLSGLDPRLVSRRPKTTNIPPNKK